jgi:hypothetical protein
MTDDATTDTPAIRTTEGTPDPMMDLFLAHWPRIAATAWEGFTGRGRGAVTVVAGSIPPALAYRAGTLCACHEELVNGYDPTREAVVAVVDDDGDVTWIAALGGWPTPGETAETTTAEVLGATVH